MRVIYDKDEVFTKDMISLMEEQYIAFEDNALMMSKRFKKSCLEYRILVEPMLSKDSLIWTIGEVNIPSEILHSSIYRQTRIGTCNSISEWKNAEREKV